mmetsp:Transcript_14381/g.21555  ORF Transcript_14381/g.21555 Transcript_14381/m.21555 type:complete len:115 (-) Transcript_14381:55-399(-)
MTESFNKLVKDGDEYVELDEAAQTLLMKHLKELTSAIVEQAIYVAKHRQSSVVDADDITLIFGKKLRLHTPDMKFKHHLYEAVCGHLQGQGKSTESTPAVPEQRRGVKRKSTDN